MKKIGRYIVRGILGRGGMSTVYKVAIPVIDKIVALKLLDPPEILLDLVGKNQLRRLFIAEAMTMASLHHPHVADVWDFDEFRGRPFFVMEYFCNNLGLMIGEHDEVEKPSRVIAPEKIIKYGSQVLQGLSCLHQAGIVHRDIKPYNILITDQDSAKIADFGLSKLHGESTPTHEHINVGSPYYSAPEQRQHPDNADLRADLFSVGVMLFRMLYGCLPQDNQSCTLQEDDFGEIWQAFFNKALARNCEERFTSAKHMLEHLSFIAEEWEKNKEKVCQFIDPDYHNAGQECISLRRDPIKIEPQKARKVFQVDQLWRPKKYIRNYLLNNGNTTITDDNTSLIWQQSGSEFPMTWDQAHEYILKLNHSNYAGSADWRLPTVDELLSLLTETGTVADYCIEPLFNQEKKWLWSSDSRSAIAAWYVSIDMGFLSWQDVHCHYYVRAVRTKN